MKNDADVDFVISEEDMVRLTNMPRIQDYGSASMMPVYAGKLTLGSVVSAIFRSWRK